MYLRECVILLCVRYFCNNFWYTSASHIIFSDGAIFSGAYRHGKRGI